MNVVLIVQSIAFFGDNQRTINVLKEVFGRRAYEVIGITGAREAKQYLAEYPASFVITMDEVEPDENGDRFLLYCREVQPSAITVSITTGSKRRIKRMYSTEQYYEISAKGYFANIDFSVSTLRKNLERFLDVIEREA